MGIIAAGRICWRKVIPGKALEQPEGVFGVIGSFHHSKGNDKFIRALAGIGTQIPQPGQ